MPSIPDPSVPAGVVAKAFLGGPTSDYRVVVGAAGTLLSEHIPSGKKVPAVEVVALAQRGLSGAVQLAKLGRGGLLGAGAAGAAVAAGAVYAVYATRKHQQGGDEATEVAPAATGTAAPILAPSTSSSSLLAEAAQAQPDMVATAKSRRGAAKGPSAGQAKSAPGQADVADTGVGPEPEAGARAGAGAGQDGPPASVDWSVVTPSEVAKARQEYAHGDVAAAVARLSQLLHFLDELPGKSASPIYPAITEAPLAALTEFAENGDLSDLSDLSEVVQVSAADVAQWRLRLDELHPGADGATSG